MGLFDLFKRKKATTFDPSSSVYANEIEADFRRSDFLSKAATAGHQAKAAVKEKRYDAAWKLYHQQKGYYMRHASRYGHSPRGALALDATVHEDLANILRLEGKHTDALVHIVYWVLAGANRPIRRHQQKLRSYFNRCKFKNITLDEAQKETASQSALPDLTLARSVVARWVGCG